MQFAWFIINTVAVQSLSDFEVGPKSERRLLELKSRMNEVFQRNYLLAGFAGILLILATTGGARAQFAVCNNSLDVVNVAIGMEDGQQFSTEGWWTIGSNQCATVIRDELTKRFIYVYAHDVFGQDVLNGTVDMCVDDHRFAIEGTQSCWTRGYRKAPFLEVDTQAVSRWTLFLTPQS